MILSPSKNFKQNPFSSKWSRSSSMKPMVPSPTNNRKLDLIHKKETNQWKATQRHHNDHKYARTNSLSWKSIGEREMSLPTKTSSTKSLFAIQTQRWKNMVRNKHRSTQMSKRINFQSSMRTFNKDNTRFLHKVSLYCRISKSQKFITITFTNI